MGELPSELDLMAYADGELEGAAAERVRRHLEGDLAAQSKVKLHHRLCAAGRRCLGEVEVPDDLKARVGNVVTEVTTPTQQRRMYIGYLSAAAAVLLIAAGGWAVWAFSNRGVEVLRRSDLVPVSYVTSAAQRHINCSKHAEHFHAGFPRKVEEMPASLRQYLGHDAVCPDLTKLGYRFIGCGPCTIPGGKTAHLLYRPINGQGGCVSLFVQPDEGQLKLENGRVYFARDEADATPMIIWRSEGVVYYLVGEDNGQLSSAAREMGKRVRI
jgi:anti-sigma factor RsiW